MIIYNKVNYTIFYDDIYIILSNDIDNGILLNLN